MIRILTILIAISMSLCFANSTLEFMVQDQEKRLDEFERVAEWFYTHQPADKKEFQALYNDLSRVVEQVKHEHDRFQLLFLESEHQNDHLRNREFFAYDRVLHLFDILANIIEKPTDETIAP